jgi:PhoH-like ATPase
MTLAPDITAFERGKEVVSSRSSSKADVVVLDTSVLLADPESIFNMGDSEVVLPLKVIEELDNQKARIDDVGRAARTVSRSLEELRCASVDRDLSNPVKLPAGGSLRVVINGQKLDLVEHLGLDTAKSDNRILAAALGLVEDGRSVRVVSADVNLRLKAAALGLAAEEYVQTRPGFHTAANPGWHTLLVSAGLVDAVYADRYVDLEAMCEADAGVIRALRSNEFGVLRAGRQSALVRRTSSGLRLIRDDLEAWGMRPRSKEQGFALDLLLDENVPIVALSGRAGTGKTMLAIAAGLEQVFEPTSRRYDRLMIIRPMYAVGRQEVGFLPGDLREKLEPWFATVEDTIAALREDQSHTEARKMIEMWVDEGRIDMQPVTYLRGRSLHKTFIIVDEHQSMETLTLKTILTRLGAGSKVVFTGDVSQIDNPFVSERTSALSVLADRFAGQPLFGHLVLTQGERSAVADLAAELL